MRYERTSLSLPAGLLDRVRIAAGEEGRSVSNWAARVFERALELGEARSRLQSMAPRRVAKRREIGDAV